MTSLGKFLKDYAPDVIVCLGDLGDWQSAAIHHNPRGTKIRQESPTIHAELEAVTEGLRLLKAAAGRAWSTRRVFIPGNHEEWLDRWVNLTPEADGLLHQAGYSRVLEEWDVGPMRENVLVDGVQYSHSQINRRGSWVATQTSAKQALAACPVSTSVFGHSHQFWTVHGAWDAGLYSPKIGISAPCFTEGKTPFYAKGQAAGWSRGLLTLESLGRRSTPNWGYTDFRSL
jgi:hypothetical protein